jgi:hypothetical protein
VVVVPEASVVRSGDETHVWRVADARLQKQAVKLGDRDARRGVYVLLAGVKEGDRILRNPSSTLVDGQAVELVAAAGSVPAATSAAKTGG